MDNLYIQYEEFYVNSQCPSELNLLQTAQLKDFVESQIEHHHYFDIADNQLEQEFDFIEKQQSLSSNAQKDSQQFNQLRRQSKTISQKNESQVISLIIEPSASARQEQLCHKIFQPQSFVPPMIPKHINIICHIFSDIIWLSHHSKTQNISSSTFVTFNIIVFILFILILTIWFPQRLMIIGIMGILFWQVESYDGRHVIQDYNNLRQQLLSVMIKLKIHSIKNLKNEEYSRELRKCIKQMKAIFQWNPNQQKQDIFLLDQLNQSIVVFTQNLKNNYLKNCILDSVKFAKFFSFKLAYFKLYFKNKSLKKINNRINQLLLFESDTVHCSPAVNNQKYKHSSIYYKALLNKISTFNVSHLNNRDLQVNSISTCVQVIRKEVQFKIISYNASKHYKKPTQSQLTSHNNNHQPIQYILSIHERQIEIQDRGKEMNDICYQDDGIRICQPADKAQIVDKLQHIMAESFKKSSQENASQIAKKLHQQNVFIDDLRKQAEEQIRQKSFYSFGISLKPPPRNLDAYYIE